MKESHKATDALRSSAHDFLLIGRRTASPPPSRRWSAARSAEQSPSIRALAD